MKLDHDICERARKTRDPRFDGRFFIAVKTTGIYCRPVCPVPPPKAKNIKLFPTAAAAAEAGFRPCLRCRPEAAPGTPAWMGTSATVGRALRRIASGALDRGSVTELAASVGVTSRHLGRLFHRYVGASPQSVAQTRRLHFAKKLLDETSLPMAEIALSSGFGSVRRFNAAFRETYHRTPGELRRNRGTTTGGTEGIVLRLAYRPPFDWQQMVGFLGQRCIRGVEQVSQATYSRTFEIDGSCGIWSVGPAAEEHQLELAVRFPDAKPLFGIASRVRKQFDLDADSAEIERHLAQDRSLRRWIKARPGLRVPGTWDPFELTVRAVLGQQVSVKGATTLATRVAQAFGRELATPMGELTHLFPTAEVLAEADLSGLGLTTSRAATLNRVAAAVVDGELSLDPNAIPETVVRQLVAIRGIGDWTAQYVAMRGFGDPDAFPATDLGLLRVISPNHKPDLRHKADLAARAEGWRPWRAYAVIYLWSSETPTTKRTAATVAKSKRSAKGKR